MNRAAWWPRTIWLTFFVLVAPVLWALLDWALFSAVFRPDLEACKAAVGEGACWGVVAEKWRIIVLGRYPLDAQWRPMLLLLVWTPLMFATAGRWLKPASLVLLWAVLAPATVLLLHGGALALPEVPTNLWSGLPLTLLISVGGFAGAFPLALLLALGRRSGWWPVRTLCIAYIETLRALPLVAVLFLAAFVLPLFLPGEGLDLFTRVLITIALFSAAYLAEVLRGGLQAVPGGQAMAAKALGMGSFHTQWLVVLPQAIRACQPGLVNSFVTLFKECSLVTIVALFELTGALGLALSGDVQWRSFYLEAYLFIGFVYWAYCFGLSKAVK